MLDGHFPAVVPTDRPPARQTRATRSRLLRRHGGGGGERERVSAFQRDQQETYASRWAYVLGMTTTDDIRRWAMALPEVQETSHFRFHVPVWKVRDRTFLGMGRDETTAVFCVSEQDADNAAATDPASYEAVRRKDARKSLLGGTSSP